VLSNLYISVNKHLFTYNSVAPSHHGNSASWDDTPLFTDASRPRGPRTPWSPVRTNVHPPANNPEKAEIEPQLASEVGCDRLNKFPQLQLFLLQLNSGSALRGTEGRYPPVEDVCPCGIQYLPLQLVSPSSENAAPVRVTPGATRA